MIEKIYFYWIVQIDERLDKYPLLSIINRKNNTN